MAVITRLRAADRWGQRPARPGLIAALRVLLILSLGITACVPAEVSPEKAIVGKWVNDQGGEIYFYADKTGFIPGLAGATEQIPDVKFTYYFQDMAHLAIVLDGQPAIVVKIKLDGDKLTWVTQHDNLEYVYTRAK